MAIESRQGAFGRYYGSTFASSEALTQTQMEANATYIYRYFRLRGWSINAICGMLGNMQAESSLNPGSWESDNVGNRSGGYGLVQWTPCSNYFEWCGSLDPSRMDINLSRIEYEFDNNIQYYPTSEYPETFQEFSTSTKSPEYLATAFLKNYERARVEVLDKRIDYANKWFEFLTGVDPSIPSISSNKRKKFNFLLFNKRRLIYGKR